MVVQGDTALHVAAQHASAGLVKLLLQHGCDPGKENLLVSYCLVYQSHCIGYISLGCSHCLPCV